MRDFSRQETVDGPGSLCKMVCSTIGLCRLKDADIRRIETECGRVALRREEGTILDLLHRLRDDPALEHLSARIESLIEAAESGLAPGGTLSGRAVLYVNSHLSRLTAFERGAALGALHRAAASGSDAAGA